MEKKVQYFTVIFLVCCILLGGCSQGVLTGESAIHNKPEEDISQENKFLVHFYDVPETEKKWGDCTYIEFPNGENMLVDIGIAKAGEWIVEDLTSQGITHIDHLIFSHFHSDHVGGYSALIKKISIGKVYSNGYIAQEMKWILQDIDDRKIPHKVLTAGDSLTIGDVIIDVLWPTLELVEEGPSLPVNDPNCVIDTNNRSLLIRFTYGENRLLMTSDLYIKAQNDILKMYNTEELTADVMKVPHHGYENAINREFIEVVNPTYAVMLGNVVMNRVGYQRYTNIGCDTYATWMNGNVWVAFDGKNVQLRADNEEINKYYK